jgi:TPR repeat protein
VQLVYLDSCRNNPFPSQSFLIGPDKKVAAAGVGLAPQDGALGSLTAFSTQPGAIAVDGSGDKSPFTESMLKQSFKLGVDVQSALVKVTQEVWDATHQKQKPWTSNTLGEPVFLAKPLIRIAAAQSQASAGASGLKVGSTPAKDSVQAATSGTSAQIAELLSESLSKPHRVPIGVGQVAMLADFPIIRAATGAQIEISAAPKSGVMYLEGKALGEGDVIDQDALRKVTFEPSIGSEDKVQDLELKIAQAGSADAASASGKIEPFVVPCDAEAAEPLDLQGVSAGKLPNEINADAGIAACTEAVQQYPAIARYKYQLGRAKLAARDVSGALAQFNEAAEAGHTRAFYQLGYMAQRGLGRAQDLAEANKLFKAASDLGDPYGMLAYGRNLAKGRGVTQDVAEGIRLLNKSVEIGHTYAMNELGSMYYYGQNLKQNWKRGIRFYEASMARGDIYAMRNMGLAYLEGKGVAPDATTALALFKKADEGGHPSAPTDIGAMYFNGNGVKKDLSEAITWYERGAERGDMWAASNLAWVYSKGPKDRRDLGKAAWYSSLAVALDAYDGNAKEKVALKSLPPEAKTQAMKKLVSEVGAENLETTSDLDQTLVALSRKAWQMRNPRLDMF